MAQDSTRVVFLHKNRILLLNGNGIILMRPEE